MQQSIRSAFESGLLRSGIFFRRQQWKEILFFIFFLLLAFVFWFLQTLQQEYEQRIEIPLRYINVPAEWILSENNPETISALLKEKGANFLYYYWNLKSHSIDISVPNLSQISDTSLLIPNRFLETELSKQLFASTSIISFTPQEIELYYDVLSSRMSIVSAQVSFTTKQGFHLSDSITVVPSNVRLYGSNKALSLQNTVNTKLIILEDISKTSELLVSLDLPAGIKSENETVKLIIPVEEFTEKKIPVRVQCIDIPKNYVLRMFPSIVEITCQLPLSHFRELTDDMLEINIPFTEFESNQKTGKVSVSLTQKPVWVVHTVVLPNELEFIIEHHD